MKLSFFTVLLKNISLVVGVSSFLTLYPTRLFASKKGYRLEFRGVENLLQLKSLKDSSNLVRYKRNSPRSMAALQYRANSDISSFIEIMHAYSYYDACVSNQTYRLPSGKLKIVVFIDKGERYLLREFQINLKEGVEPCNFQLNKIHLRDLDIALKKPAVSTQVVEAKEKLIQNFTDRGYPLAKISEEKIIVDQAQKSISIDLEVDPGAEAYFGQIYLETNSDIKSRYIRNRIKWKEGELYSSEKLRRTEKALYDTGLFSLASVTPGDHLTKEGRIPIHIQLMDSKFNSFSLGGSYTTTWEGLGGQAAWNTRNLFSTGTDFNINYQANRKLQEAGITYTFPDFLSRNQVIVLTSSVSHNIQPNFTEKAVKTELYVERILSPYFKTSLGSKFDQLETSKSDHNGYFSLFGIPWNLKTQSSENVLINPTQGGWANLTFIPYFSLSRSNGNFAEVKIEGSVYQFIIPSRRIVLAMNMVFGSLFGESNYEIPTPYRYFAGSPNHLRGYPYHEVSPIDGGGKPIGGRSEFLWSIESRFMIFKSIAVVGFLDVGNVYTTTWPRWHEALLKSLGVGVRYFSFVGPLRLDIGFPMNKRPNIKKKYQIYFSFGQPF